ncbi:MAG: hypothetical protein WCI56_02635 [Hyphomicrobiales bacterium]
MYSFWLFFAGPSIAGGVVPVAIDDIAKQMLALLPNDGTPVLNRVMQVMLSRELGVAIDQDQFFTARDALLQQGRVGRLRGQGGQVFLLRELQPNEAPVAAQPERWPEARLMASLKIYLEGPFRKGLELPPDGICLVQDTSAMGPVRGRWARPDFILIAARRFKFIPSPQLDVHSFELKTETGADDLAVYEALAQTRFTHFGYLVWHLPDQSKAETRLDEIEKQCEEHGIGLIRMRDPNDPNACEILLDPVRKATLAATVDDFLELRLTDAQRKDIQHAMTEARP